MGIRIKNILKNSKEKKEVNKIQVLDVEASVPRQ